MYNRPGPPVTRSGGSPTYFVPWRDKVPLQEKLDQILEWVDIGDIEKRPELILSKRPFARGTQRLLTGE